MLREERLDRTFAFMSELNLDILLVASTDSIQNRGNVRFLTNYSTAFASSIAILSRGGDLILLVPAGSFQLGWAENMAWVRDIRAVRDFVATAIDLLNEIGSRRATVGLVGFESLHGSIDSQVTTSLPKMRFERVTKPFVLMRAIKTRNETDMVRRSAALADSVFEELPSAIRVGTSESEIFARAEYLLVSGGAEDHFLLGSSEPKTVMPMPTERSLREHDVIRFSVEAAAPGGFWTQTIRVFSLGNPTPEIRNAFDLCVEALEHAREKLRPGTTGGEIARAMIGVVERAGGGHIGPLGHGMGLDLTEPPYLYPEDETIIESGTVIAIHPCLTWDEVNIWIGDTFLVTENGPERLSRNSTDLRVL